MNKEFWNAAMVRALRTFAQTAGAMVPAAVMIQQVDWLTIVATAATSAILSLLTSIATGLPETQED